MLIYSNGIRAIEQWWLISRQANKRALRSYTPRLYCSGTGTRLSVEHGSGRNSHTPATCSRAAGAAAGLLLGRGKEFGCKRGAGALGCSISVWVVRFEHAQAAGACVWPTEKAVAPAAVVLQLCASPAVHAVNAQCSQFATL
jgi:hypothetical protein